MQRRDAEGRRFWVVPFGRDMPNLPPPAPWGRGEVLGPAPGPAPETTWFAVRVLDEVGDPVDGVGVAYSIGGRRRIVTTNGAGVAILAGIDAAAATAAVASAAAVREKLEPRWKEPRDASVPAGPDVTMWNVAQLDRASLSLAPKKTATLVLTPNVLVVRVPYTLEQSARLPHGLTLKSADGAVSRARALASDGRGASDGRTERLFTHVPEVHAYTLEAGRDGANEAATATQADESDDAGEASDVEVAGATPSP